MNIPQLQDALRNQIYVLNQLFVLKRRLGKCQLPDGTLRPLERIEEYLSGSLHVAGGLLPDGAGLVMDDPQGEPYDDRRTEIEADVIGAGDDPLFIVEVLKPIIRLTIGGRTFVIQRGQVVVAPRAVQGETA